MKVLRKMFKLLVTPISYPLIVSGMIVVAIGWMVALSGKLLLDVVDGIGEKDGSQ